MTERITFHFDEVVSDGRFGALWKWRGRCAIANGCFDGCHPGHLKILASLDTEAYARRLRPIVAMNSDVSVRNLKGRDRPMIPQHARSFLVNHLKWPLTVVLFDEESPQALMDWFMPVVVIKGGEYDPRSVVKWKESEVLTIPMEEGWSTSKILGDTR